MKRKSIFLRCFAIVLVYICLGIQHVSAQDWDHEYVPFVEEGKVWNCQLVSSEGGKKKSKDCVFTMQGDTIIGNQIYKKVLCEYKKYYGDSAQHYYCAVREEAYRVYSVEPEATDEEFLYDFSSPSDTLYFSYPDCEFGRIEGRCLDGYPKNQYMFDIQKVINGKANILYSLGEWWEGVGYRFGNPFVFFLDQDNQEQTPEIFVMSCMKGDEYIYKLDWTVQPSSVTSSTERMTPQKELFDLQGRRIQGEPKHGVYIQNGKKVMR